MEAWANNKNVMPATIRTRSERDDEMQMKIVWKHYGYKDVASDKLGSLF